MFDKPLTSCQYLFQHSLQHVYLNPHLTPFWTLFRKFPAFSEDQTLPSFPFFPNFHHFSFNFSPIRISCPPWRFLITPGPSLASLVGSCCFSESRKPSMAEIRKTKSQHASAVAAPNKAARMRINVLVEFSEPVRFSFGSFVTLLRRLAFGQVWGTEANVLILLEQYYVVNILIIFQITLRAILLLRTNLSFKFTKPRHSDIINRNRAIHRSNFSKNASYISEKFFSWKNVQHCHFNRKPIK